MAVTTTVPSTLVDIRTKFRRITATPSPTQLDDVEVDKYIQTFYVQDFPEHLRLHNLKETYTFSTLANIDSYAFDRNHYVTIQPPLFIDGYQGFYSQSPEQFYGVWPKIQFQENLGNGTGLINQTFQVTSTPIYRAQPRYAPGGSSGTFDSDIMVCIRQQDPVSGLYTTIQTMIDDGLGNLIDSAYLNTETAIPPAVPLLGTVNYLTGLFTIFAAIPVNQEVMITTVPYTPGRPTSALFFDDRIVLRPVPDSCYKVSIECYRNPIEFLLTSNSPELEEWWQVIALGAALKFFEDQGSMDDYVKFLPVFEKYKLLAQRRTIVQQTNQRTATIYEQQVTPSLYNNFWNRF